MIKKLRKVGFVLAIICTLSTNAFAANKVTGQTTGGSAGRSVCNGETTIFNANFPWETDSMNGYTTADRTIMCNISICLHWGTTSNSGNLTASAISSATKYVSTGSSGIEATSANSAHSVTSVDYGNWSGNTSMTF